MVRKREIRLECVFLRDRNANADVLVDLSKIEKKENIVDYKYWMATTIKSMPGVLL